MATRAKRSAFSLPTVNTNALGISQISMLIAAGDNHRARRQAVRKSFRLLRAITWSRRIRKSLLRTRSRQITTNEAQIGAQIVAMGDDSSDDNTTIVNLQSSASNITDLNVGQATTDYTREQILTSVGTEVLSQIQSNGKIMTALLIQALIA